MLVIIYISAIITIAYVAFATVTFIGFLKAKKNSDNIIESTKQISVIVPFKNEANNILRLIESLKKQTNSNFNVLLIDDNSTDNSYSIAEKAIIGIRNFSLYKNPLSGKKRAIEFAVSESTNNYFVTTDADCLITKNWINSIVKNKITTSNQMVIMPVLMTTSDNSFLSHFQRNDYLALQMTTAGMAAVGNPVMCSGANLYFTKELYNNCKRWLHFDLPSGDDMFLMLASKKQQFNIGYLLDNNVAVETKSEIGLRNFVNQRIRWGSKAKNYTDKGVIIIGLIPLLTYLSVLINIILSVNNFIYLFTALATMAILTICNYFLIYSFIRFFKKQKKIKYFVLSQLVYLLYFPIIALLSFIGIYKWK